MAADELAIIRHMDFIAWMIVAAAILVALVLFLRRSGTPDEPPRDDHPGGEDSDIETYPGELGPSGPATESESAAQPGGPAPGTPGGTPPRGDNAPSADKA